MKLIIVCLLLSSCANVTPAQKERIANDAYKACKVIVQVREAMGDAGASDSDNR